MVIHIPTQKKRLILQWNDLSNWTFKSMTVLCVALNTCDHDFHNHTKLMHIDSSDRFSNRENVDKFWFMKMN